MKNYLAITLGPIIEFLNHAKSTRELDQASRFFSELSLFLIENLQEKIKLPIMPKINIHAKENEGAPDRIIYDISGYNNNADLLKEINDIKNKFISKKFEKEWVASAEKYFQCHAVIYEANKAEAIEMAYTILDHLELSQETLLNTRSEKELGRILLEHLAAQSKTLVPSTTEIGIYSLFTKIKYEDYREKLETQLKLFCDESSEEYTEEQILKPKFIEKLKNEFPEVSNRMEGNFPKYHKYIAVVQADGDSVGALLKKLYRENSENYSKVQEKLSKFAEEAQSEIQNFGGWPVYIGGDDILCFMPLKGHEEKLLIEKLVEIDRKFAEIISSESPDAKKSSISLSFGVSLYYYKYPLEMARFEAEQLLFNKAKKYVRKNSDKEKHALAIKLIKHSGKSNEVILPIEEKCFEKNKENELLEKTIKLWKNFSNFNKSSDNSKLTSVIHKLIEDKNLIRTIIISDINNSTQHYTKEKISNYFDNNFNEKIHGNFIGYLNEIKEYIYLIIERLENSSSSTRGNENELIFKKEFDEAYENFLNVLEIGQFFAEEDRRA